MPWDTQFFRYTSLKWGNLRLSSALLVVLKRDNVQQKSVVIDHGMHTTNAATWSQPLIPVIISLVLRHRNTCCVFLVDVIQTHVLTIGAASAYDRMYNTYGTHECRSPTDCMDASQEGVMIVAWEKYVCYHSRIGTSPTECPGITL
jgi:hypothetical protein